MAAPLVAALAAVLLAAGCGPVRPRGPQVVGAREAPQAAAGVHFRSWVLPLDPARLDGKRAPMEFWQIAAAEARRRGGVVEAPRNPPKPVRDLIVVLDTPDQALRRNGFVLRRRGRDRRGQDPGTCEFTLEARTTDIRAAHATNVQSSGKEPFTQHFAEEVVVLGASPPGTSPSLWSMEGNVRRYDKGRTMTVGELQAIFPGTAGRFGAPDAPLLPVNGTNLEQTEVDLGTIVFGATRARAAVVVWREVPTRRPIAADFELVEKLPDYWSQQPADAGAARETMAAVQAAARGWLGSMPTRAEAVYGVPFALPSQAGAR
ncbi:hypothetical protein KGQ64_03815 [bacterium]|nr:hypothetical protein [bacterium]